MRIEPKHTFTSGLTGSESIQKTDVPRNLSEQVSFPQKPTPLKGRVAILNVATGDPKITEVAFNIFLGVIFNKEMNH